MNSAAIVLISMITSPQRGCGLLGPPSEKYGVQASLRVGSSKREKILGTLVPPIELLTLGIPRCAYLRKPSFIRISAKDMRYMDFSAGRWITSSTFASRERPEVRICLCLTLFHTLTEPFGHHQASGRQSKAFSRFSQWSTPFSGWSVYNILPVGSVDYSSIVPRGMGRTIP